MVMMVTTSLKAEKVVIILMVVTEMTPWGVMRVMIILMVVKEQILWMEASVTMN